MKLKSFKKKEAYGVSPKQSAFEQSTPRHLCFGVDQIDQIKNRVEFGFGVSWEVQEVQGEYLALYDVVALAIGDDPEPVMAIVTDVVQVDNRGRSELSEYRPTQLPHWSSKQLTSLRWTRFLTELKKKCGCGHHNKKRKTLLHVIKMAQGREADPESIQLTVRRTALANAQNHWQDLVAQIQEDIVEAATEGLDIDLRRLENFFPDEVVVQDAEHVPKKARFDATTYVMNGFPLRRQSLSSIETISIPKEKFLGAATFHTGDDPLTLSNPEVIWFLNIYNHKDDLIVHNNRRIENISVSQDGSEYILELEDDWAVRAAPAMANIDNALITIFGYEAVADSPAEVDPTSGNFDYLNHKERDVMLAIGPDRYKFLTPNSDDGQQRLGLTHPIGRALGSQFEEGDKYWVDMGDTQSLVRVESVITDPVKRTATVEFSYQGGDKFKALSKGLFSMKRALIASAKKSEEIKLTLERAALAAALLDGGSDGDVLVLEEIADGINQLQLLQDDPDNPGVSLSELADWFEQKPADADLAVAGVEYNPIRPEYHTDSSVTSGVEIDVWMSVGGENSYFDLDPELGNVESVVHSSTLVNELPVSEVKGEKFAQSLDEVRQQVLEEVRRQQGFPEVDPDPPISEIFFSQYHRLSILSIYNEDGGYAVCNNEPIWRILRKKKDGKCIYRIVVKNGVRANRIHHGKHRKCIMYLDRLYRADDIDDSPYD